MAFALAAGGGVAGDCSSQPMTADANAAMNMSFKPVIRLMTNPSLPPFQAQINHQMLYWAHPGAWQDAFFILWFNPVQFSAIQCNFPPLIAV